MERKALTTAQFKLLDSGNGGMSCRPSEFGVLDSYGDIVLPGAYQKTCEKFLSRGFIAHSHDWTYKGVVGYPTSAYEDGDGFVSEMEFHGDAESQSIRQKAKERMEAGKEVLLSIGFMIDDEEVIYPHQYQEKLPQILSGEKLTKALERCREFKKIRLLKEIDLYEFSIVTVPALECAAATSVKAAPAQNDGKDKAKQGKEMTKETKEVRKGVVELRGKYLGEYAESQATMSAISGLISRLMWGPVYDCLYDDDMEMDARVEMLTGSFDELRDLSLKVFCALCECDDAEMKSQADSIKELWVDPKTDDLASGAQGLALTKNFDIVVSAVDKVLERSSERKQFRAKEGRKQSATTVEFLRGLKTRLESLIEDEAEIESKSVEGDAAASSTESKDDEQAAFEAKRRFLMAQHQALTADL